MTAGILAISDRASASIYQDHGGPALRSACEFNRLTVHHPAFGVAPDQN